jgi:RNA polymerase sigma factor (sigma-70 family)
VATQYNTEATSSQAASAAFNSMGMYLKEIRKTKLLTAEEEYELALQVEAGDSAARSRMIESNLRLVVKIAKRYINRGMPFTDLVEEGNMGLIKAVERFRADRGCRFSTYATWWIRQSIERSIVNQVRTVRLPVHVSDDMDRIRRRTRDLKRRYGRAPTESELVRETGLPLHTIKRLQSLKLSICSIDQSIDPEGEFTVGDRLEDTAVTDPCDVIHLDKLVDKMQGKMMMLTDREKRVLEMRFGLFDDTPMTLESIGHHFGVTRERIRQIQVEALLKIRDSLEEDGMNRAAVV